MSHQSNGAGALYVGCDVIESLDFLAVEEDTGLVVDLCGAAPREGCVL